MKEEEFKKMMAKSTLKTSDEFLDHLMDAIDVKQEVHKSSIWWSYKSILVGCMILIFIITFSLVIFLNYESSLLNSIKAIPKIPILLAVTLISFYAINNIIKLNEEFLIQRLDKEIE